MDPLPFVHLPQEWATAVLVVDYTIKAVALGTVPEDRHPGSSHAWLLLILLVPVVGIPLFLLLGSAFLRGRRTRIQLEATLMIEEEAAELPTIPEGAVVDDGVRTIMEMNRRLTSIPGSSGRFEGIWHDYSDSLQAMTEAVDAARESVHVEFYAQSWDDETDGFFTALVGAAARGVDVRVLADHLGSLRYRGFRTLRRRLRGTGVHWHYMLPVNPLAGRFRRPDLRNHRKMLVVDGEVAFAGSQNLIERYYGRRGNRRRGQCWNDVMVRVSGEVVAGLDAVFAVDWYTEAGERLEAVTAEDAAAAGERRAAERDDGCDCETFQVIPSGPGYPSEPNMRTFTQLTGRATRSLRIVSPYFVPNEALLESVTSAAYRGVDVELFVPERADQFLVHHAQRSYYRVLLESGVRIFLYPTPEVLHTKLMLVDDEVCVIGSSNFDMRSFLLNFEVSLLMVGGQGPVAARDVVDHYRRRSSELDLWTWERRPWPGRYVDNVARLTSSLQ